MPLMKKKLFRKKRTSRPKKSTYRRRPLRRARDVPDLASVSVNKTLLGAPNQSYFVSNLMYSIRDLQLLQFDRAVQVAQAYQHFRIKKVTLKIKPNIDTFFTSQQPGGVAQANKPSFYYLIDKSGSMIQSPTLEMLKQAGCKPHRLDEKPINISWRPSVLTGTAVSAGGVMAGDMYRVSPWLSTSRDPLGVSGWVPNNSLHQGIFFYAETNNADLGVSYTIDIEVQFQFKKPIWTALPADQAARPALLTSTADSSPDGIQDQRN